MPSRRMVARWRRDDAARHQAPHLGALAVPGSSSCSVSRRSWLALGGVSSASYQRPTSP